MILFIPTYFCYCLQSTGYNQWNSTSDGSRNCLSPRKVFTHCSEFRAFSLTLLTRKPREVIQAAWLAWECWRQSSKSFCIWKTDKSSSEGLDFMIHSYWYNGNRKHLVIFSTFQMQIGLHWYKYQPLQQQWYLGFMPETTQFQEAKHTGNK